MFFVLAVESKQVCVLRLWNWRFSQASVENAERYSLTLWLRSFDLTSGLTFKGAWGFLPFCLDSPKMIKSSVFLHRR
jgi:hypothetical protein